MYKTVYPNVQGVKTSFLFRENLRFFRDFYWKSRKISPKNVNKLWQLFFLCYNLLGHHVLIIISIGRNFGIFRILFLQSHQNAKLPMASKIEQLRAWLTTTNQFFESINLKKDQRRLSYADYLQFRKELETQEPFYTKLKSQHEDKSLGDYTHSWKDIDTNWQKVETQVILIPKWHLFFGQGYLFHTMLKVQFLSKN